MYTHTMEKVINSRIDEYMIEFKNEIKKKITDLHLADNQFQQTNELLEFIFEYRRLNIQASELTKKKPTQESVIDEEHRCKAIRASGEPCNRRKKTDCDYCGTHDKCAAKRTKDQKQLEVTAEEIEGIIYYVDAEGNVYHTEDVLDGQSHSRVIARIHRQAGVSEYTLDQLTWLKL